MLGTPHVSSLCGPGLLEATAVRIPHRQPEERAETPPNALRSTSVFPNVHADQGGPCPHPGPQQQELTTGRDVPMAPAP